MKIDYSQLQTFVNCPRKYKYRYIECLRKIKYDERDLDKNFGHWIHSGLATYYKTKDVGKAKQVFLEGYVGLEREKAKTPANGEKLLQLYTNYWNQPVNELSDTNLEVLDTEVVLEYPITNELTWLVKLDTIVRNNAGIWSLEHKTTRSISYNYYWQFDPNMQISGQCWGIKQKYNQCSGCIVNVISVGYRQRAYRGEPAGFYCEFARDIINRNEVQLKDFLQNVVRWCAMVDLAKETGVYPKNENACHSFKGCGFKELCISCDDEQVKESLYEKYNPFEYLETGTKT